MNKAISKWPSKVLNLLVVLSMVIALCAVLAPQMAEPVKAQGHSLDVSIVTPVDGQKFAVDDHFYVNVVVVNLNQSDPLTDVVVELKLSGNAVFADTEPHAGATTSTKTITSLPSKETRDVWWEVECTDWGDVVIKATELVESNTDTVTVSQTTNPILDIWIVEPDPALGEDRVCVSDNFVVKAHFKNVGNETLANVNGTLYIQEQGGASLIAEEPGDPPGPSRKVIGTLQPGEEGILGWVLHCDRVGPVDIKVNATASYGAPKGGSVPEALIDQKAIVTVHQGENLGVLQATITSPQNGDNFCKGCDDVYTLTAKIWNSGCRAMTEVEARLMVTGNATFTPQGWRSVASTLLPGNSTTNFVSVPWNWKCAGNGTVTFTVETRGYNSADNLIGPVSSAVVTVNQQPLVLKLEFVDPIVVDINGCVHLSYDPVRDPNTCDQGVTVRATVENCSGSEMDDVTITLTAQDGLVASFSPTSYTDPNKLCGCCDFTKDFTVACRGAGSGTILGTVTEGSATYTATDTLCVVQEAKAHLIAGLAFFQGYPDMADPDDDNFVTTPVLSVNAGQVFTVVVPVYNAGEAAAYDVKATLTIVNLTGSAILATGETAQKTIVGNITGGEAGKAIWKVVCTSTGTVKFRVNDVELVLNLSGRDFNTKQPIRNDTACANIDAVCPVTIWQIPPPTEVLEVEIIQPDDGSTWKYCDIFTVKAKIRNIGNVDLVGVNASIDWLAGEHLELWDSSTGAGGSWGKFLGDIPVGHTDEVGWVVHCTGEGDVHITVTANVATPRLEESDSILIHQIGVPQLQLEILSPGSSAYIATGEEFVVTAALINMGDRTAEGVNATIGFVEQDVSVGMDDTLYLVYSCITPQSETVLLYHENAWVQKVRGTDYAMNYELGYLTWLVQPDPVDQYNITYLPGVSLVEGEATQGPFDVAPGGIETVTWTLRANTSCAPQCQETPVHLGVWAMGTNFTFDPNYHARGLEVGIYPAAHLVAEIVSVTPASPLPVCEEFEVAYKIWNTGQADAWEVSATLSVDPAYSVRLAGGEEGYTQTLGTVAGWKQIGEYAYKEGVFTLHCKQACESTITITPAGNDECGFKVELDIASRYDHYELMSLPGREIDAEFIVAASTTVKQLENGVDLAITKTANKTMAPAEAQVKFTITVTNNGPIAASGIVVTDTWTTGALVTPAVISKSQGSLSAFTSTGFTWTVGSLPVNGTATLVYSAVSSIAGKITNTAIVRSAEADGILDNNTASVELNVVSMQFTLKPGWNLFSLPLVPGNSSTVNVVGGITQVAYVYGYDAETGTWSWWTPPNLGTLTNMTDGWGYWIYLTGSINKNITITGTELPPVIAGSQPPVPPSYDVFVGWNLLGFKSTTAKAENVYLAGIHGLYIRIYGYADGAYFDVVDGANLQPGMGYWIAVPGAVPGIKVGSIFP